MSDILLSIPGFKMKAFYIVIFIVSKVECIIYIIHIYIYNTGSLLLEEMFFLHIHSLHVLEALLLHWTKAGDPG